jgi:hypothetical protein
MSRRREAEEGVVEEVDLRCGDSGRVEEETARV